MYPASFEYHRVATVEEAVGLLTRHKDDAKLLAGGHSLIPMMKLRLAQPKHLVDIGRVNGLSGIREEGGHFVIGALTTHYAVESSAAIKQKCPMLSEAAAMIGDPQVRNYGTVGGSVAHSDPAADWPAVMLALGAEIKAVGPKGARTIKVDADRLRGKRIASTGLVLWGERDRILRRDLTRWIDRQFTHPTRKVFFPDVGHWVIEEACRQAAEWRDSGLRMRVSINISATQLRRLVLVDRLGQTTRIDFDGIERNPRLEPSSFSFTPPPGVDVVGRAPAEGR